MKKKVMVISSGGFAVRPVLRQIQSERLEALQVNPLEAEIRAHVKEVSIIIFMMDKEVYGEENLFRCLREVASSKGVYLCLFGDSISLNIAESRLATRMISFEQRKPYDVSEMLDELLPVIAKNEGVSVSSLLNRKKSILLVDDDTTFLRMMKAWLGPFYRVTAVSSGAQALSYLTKRKTDLVLLDYEMPVMSGPEALATIRENDDLKNLPVIFLTGKDDRESIMKVLAYHPDGYLLKSNGRDLVLKKLREFFEETSS